MGYLIVVWFLILCSCGEIDQMFGKDEKVDSVTEAPLDPRFLAAVGDLESLPPCVPGHEGLIRYVTANRVFYACSNGVWGQLDLRGNADVSGGTLNPAYPVTTEYHRPHAYLPIFRPFLLGPIEVCTLCKPFPPASLSLSDTTDKRGRSALNQNKKIWRRWKVVLRISY